MNCICGINKPLNPYTAKCWTYSRKNFISTDGDKVYISPLPAIKAKTFYPTLATGIPIFKLNGKDSSHNTTGLFSFEFGGDYFYKRNKFLSIKSGVATDLPLGEYFGTGYRELGSSVYFSVRNNYKLQKLEIGYGINISRLFWRGFTYGDTVKINNRIKTTGLGLSLSARYNFMRGFGAAILYQPSLININRRPVFNYQHYIAIQCSWRLPQLPHRKKGKQSN